MGHRYNRQADNYSIPISISFTFIVKTIVTEQNEAVSTTSFFVLGHIVLTFIVKEIEIE